MSQGRMYSSFIEALRKLLQTTSIEDILASMNLPPENIDKIDETNGNIIDKSGNVVGNVANCFKNIQWNAAK